MFNSESSAGEAALLQAFRGFLRFPSTTVGEDNCEQRAEFLGLTGRNVWNGTAAPTRLDMSELEMRFFRGGRF